MAAVGEFIRREERITAGGTYAEAARTFKRLTGEKKVPPITTGVVATIKTIDPVGVIDPALVKNDPYRRLSKTPWGPGFAEYRFYVGLAVPWKHYESKEGGVNLIPARVLEKNLNFARIASGLKGTKGVAYGVISGTDWKGRPYVKARTAPKIAFEIARQLGKDVNIIAEGKRIEELVAAKAGTMAVALVA